MNVIKEGNAMARLQKLNIPKAIDPRVRGRLSAEEIDAILELSFLAIVADGRLSEPEMGAFSDALVALADPHQIQSLMNRLANTSIHQQEDVCFGVDSSRLRTLAGKLRSQAAREQAYKLAYAMAMSDVHSGDCEFRYDQDLRKALGLTDEAAEQLIDQVVDIVGSPT